MAAKQRIHPVILAGGSGVRLWPLSRSSHPKPFLYLTGEKTFLQMTVTRVSGDLRFAPPVVICADAHRFLVAEQLRNTAESLPRIVLEPVARNTAPAACIAALMLAAEHPDDLLMLLPADHFIENRQDFLRAVDHAAAAAAEGWIATFGARPERPETGYGYIQRGEELDRSGNSFRVARFVEKPDRTTAEDYLADGGYSWNSGMFIVAARVLLEEMERFEPRVLNACRTALEHATSDEDFLRLDEAAFADQPNISFDYAVMERSQRSAVVPIDIGWSDVGSWDALYQMAIQDGDGNVLKGDVVAVDSRNSYLHSQAGTIAALGLDGVAVIATRDAILVCPRDCAQNVSLVVDRLKADPRYEALMTRELSEDDNSSKMRSRGK